MIRVAIYCRSSKDRSDVSIDAQRRQLQELAAARGMSIVAEFSDAVESGKDDDRPDFQRMLRELRNPRRGWDAVLVLDTARIARRRHLAIIFEEHECKRAGVRVIYKSLPESDPITEMLLKSILQAMDEWHSLTSRSKGLAGMSENVKQGYRAGGSAPKGYRLDAIATGAIRDGQPVTKSKLVPGDDAMLVRAYLQHRARGLSRARALALVGAGWPVTTLLYMERNALTYAGHTIWNRHAERDGTRYQGGDRYRPREEWVIERNTHEALISEDEANIITAAAESRRPTRAREGVGYMLRGLLMTPDGQKWHADGDGSYRVGKGKRIKASEVDAVVLDAIKADIVSDEFASAVLDHYRALAKPASRDRSATKAAARIREIEQQTHRLAELMGQTTAPEALLRSIEKLEAERDGLAEQIAASKEAEKAATSLRSLTLAQVKTFLGNIQVEDMDNDAMAALVERITLDPATMEARIYYKICQLTGDKLASPRGTELIPAFASPRAVVIPHRRRAAI
jgi:DNA invertase Pin-like site-specific DNA recombinase